MVTDLALDLVACLRDVGSGLTLQMRWYDDGERRARPFYGRHGGQWHAVPLIVRLAQLGLIEGATEACDVLVLSDQGRAWLKAHPPPAA